MMSHPVAESAALRPHAAPFLWPLLAGLPVGLCLVVMALPDLGHGHATAYRMLYLIAFLVWIVPLTALQRALWRRRVRWWIAAPLLLAVTYAVSLANNALGVALAVLAGWKLSSTVDWSGIFSGLEGCWLALIAYCAIHAVLAYALELGREQARHREAESLARDAELRALRYQLQPHFLFNTLNAISSLVVEGRNDQARATIARLGDFLRSVLRAGEGHETSLADELALTDDYLDIERARLGERLRLQWRIGGDVLAARVPRLLLQPLVENAIRHGIARRRATGTLAIEIARHDKRLRLRIGNDGPEDAATESAAGAAIGLRNLGERLDRLYPGDHAFVAGARDDGGFEVALDLPYRAVAASEPVPHA